MKTAVIQMHVGADKRENMARATALVAQAASRGAEVVVLPEMFNTPYQTKKFPLYAEKAGGKCWSILSGAARKNRVYLIGGSIPECEERGRVYNTSFVFDRNGAQIAFHRKAHLFDIDVPGGQRFKESETLTAGEAVTTFETEFGTMGLLICYDFRFPEMSRIMANRGAKVIFVPAAFNMTTGPAHWELLFRSRAVDNQVYTVGVAPARDPSASYQSWGHSIVCSPWGDVIMQADETESVAITALDLDRLCEVRSQLPLLKQRRTDVYRLEQVHL